MEVFEGGEDTAEGTGIGFGVDELIVEGIGAAGMFCPGCGDEEFGPGPGEAVEEVREDGLAMELEEGLGLAHAGALSAGEDGKGDLFARGHGWGV